MSHAIADFEAPLMKKRVTQFQVGDQVEVHVRIVEGDKERVQIFTGTVIARKGAGVRETFTVRRIVQGEGVERVFPIHSPRVARIKVRRRGRVRRAKLYYLRERTGKATRLREVRLGTDFVTDADHDEPKASKKKDAKAKGAKAKK